MLCMYMSNIYTMSITDLNVVILDYICFIHIYNFLFITTAYKPNFLFKTNKKNKQIWTYIFQSDHGDNSLG